MSRVGRPQLAARPLPANRLLDSIPRKDRQRLLARCENVEVAPGDVLCRLGEPLSYAYFPVESFVSLVSPVDGGLMQVGMVGDEGMVGALLALGADDASMHAVVQGGGAIWRIRSAKFIEELGRSSVLRQRVHRYLCVLVAQLAQNSGCARFHLVEARLARWLLMARDRAHANEFVITHELLADMLGVHRVGVTNAAGELQDRKLIRYTRGKITILNNRGLEAAACACYRDGKQVYESMFP